MDITQFIETYGKPAFKDLLNIHIIRNPPYQTPEWRMFCIRHGIIKHTTKTVTALENYRSDSTQWGMENGKLKNLGKYYTTRIKLINGANRTIFALRFTDEQLEEWKQSETNPNQG